MIVHLHKYLIYGTKSDMDRFFNLAQRGGFIEFIGSSHKKALEMPDDAKSLLQAIKILKHHVDVVYAPRFDHDCVPFAKSIVRMDHDLIRLEEEERLVSAEIQRVQAFGDFNRKELNQLEKETNLYFQFFCMKSQSAKEFTLPDELIYVGSEFDLDYFVSINREKTQYPKMIEITIDHPIGELKEKLSRIRDDYKRIEKQIHEAATFMPYLQEGLNRYLDEYHLQLAKHDAAKELGDSLFVIEAWVPQTKISSLKKLIHDLEVEAEEIAIEERDKVPTCMENFGNSKIGEDLVAVYDTPSSNDKDPSLWILGFFILFFAMIIADAGYGLIYLSIGLLLKFRYKNPSNAIKRFTKLVIIASSACIVWGALTASFFGIQIGPDNPFRKASFLHTIASKKAEYHIEKKDDVYQEYLKEYPQIANVKNGHDFLITATNVVDGEVKYVALEEFYDNLLLELSLFMGLIHLSISFLRYMDRNLTGIGWILFMVGGYLYFPSFLDATSFLNILGLISKPVAYYWGEIILYSGLAAVLMISILQGKKLGALHELTNGIQVFADVLSYLRLYALALAGMIMASTFNDLAFKVGSIGGFFVLIIGHAVNLSLAIMSGVIHGLRLNFLEWYHYSFEGGGRLFNPLSLRKIK